MVPAHADVTPFTAGSGFAGGRSVALLDVFGGAQLGFNLDDATAAYQDGIGSASGAPIDSGFTTLLSELQTCGQYAYPPSLVPPTTQVSTNSTHNQAPVHATNQGASTAVLASVDVSARPNADGRADVTSGSGGVPGLVALTGATVHTQTTTQPAAAHRVAVADVRDGDIALLGGLVHLRGLHWNATVDVAGADSRHDHRAVTPTFEIGGMSFAGVPVPTLDALNHLLAPLGVQLRQPAVTTQPNGVTVGPLVVALGGRTLVGPVLQDAFGGETLPRIEDALKPGVFDPRTCAELGGLLRPIPALNAQWNLLGSGYPIIVGAAVATLDGGGELDVDLGGATATIDDTYYPAFGFGVPQQATSTFGSPGSVSVVPGTAPTPGPAPVAPTPPLQDAASHSSTSRHCDCWGGHLGAAALGAAAVTAVVMAADEVRRRRRRARTI